MNLGRRAFSSGSTFNNTNTVNLTAGSLLLANSGTDSGTFAVSAGADRKSVGEGKSCSGMRSGARTLRVSGATLTITGSPSSTNLQLDAGAINGAGTRT